MFTLTECSGIELLVMLGMVLLLSVLFAEVFDWSRVFSFTDSIIYQYGYRNHNGPVTWKCRFPNSKGCMQSPINITTNYAIVVPVETHKPLKFSSEYYVLPKCIQLCNDGHSVTLYAYWNCDGVPVVGGGPLNGCYRFFNLRFRWGPTNDSGSEHTIDIIQYTMEIQATHIRADHHFKTLAKAAEDNALVIISYLYQVTPYDNPYLDTIIANLKNISTPLNQCSIEPIPLSWVAPPFTSQYYSYHGSLTHPPCTEGVHWLIQSEPLSISSNQIKMFRKLLAFDGPMLTNARPIQEVNCRDIFLYD